MFVRELVQALPSNDVHYWRTTLVETFLVTSLREIELRLGEEAAFANFSLGHADGRQSDEVRIKRGMPGAVAKYKGRHP